MFGGGVHEMMVLMLGIRGVECENRDVMCG